MFSKILESKKYEQICVIMAPSDGDGAPSVWLFFKPRHMGVSKVVCRFGLNKKAEKAFDEMDLEQAERLVDGAVKRHEMQQVENTKRKLN